MNLLSGLNDQQREAVTTTEGPLLVLAGAGSGKTRVITFRIAHLICEAGIPPINILAVTFTNRAAGEMRKRVELRLRADPHLPSAPLISTFHSLSVRILRRDIEALQEGYTRSFTIYDQDDSLRILKGAIKDLGYDPNRISPRSAQVAISNAKNNGQEHEAFLAAADYQDEKRAAIGRVYKVYEERLKENNGLDFDDLLIKTVRLLRLDQDSRDRYNERFRYILVDEYQDTNSLQFALIRLLTQKQQNICVVGDEDQSIYKWRGADIGNILNFEKQFPAAKIIRLEQNYRSTGNILAAAGSVVQCNKQRIGKNLWTQNPSGERIRYFQAQDAENEARFVAARLQQHCINEPHLRAAVLYRTNSQSRLFEDGLRRAQIPYNIVGGFSFYERSEVRDIIAYLKLALNPHDSVACMRVINTPPRGLGKQTLQELESHARNQGLSYWEAIHRMIESENFSLGTRVLTGLRSFHHLISTLATVVQTAEASDAVKAAILHSGYEQLFKNEGSEEAAGRLENLQELVNAAVEYEKEGEGGLRGFIDTAALASDTDQYRGDARVTLMTIHSAKGLEFPLVFLVGLEDGLLPHSRAISDIKELEEERRLCYVAITRAERYLYISHSRTRRIYGEQIASEPSQFLNELPLELMEDISQGSSWLSFKIEPKTLAKKIAKPSVPLNQVHPTYNSVESISRFFQGREKRVQTPNSQSRVERNTSSTAASPGADFTPGTYVRHPKYGRGLVLRREGSGEAAKLTITFPGFGQKKLVERYAQLERA